MNTAESSQLAKTFYDGEKRLITICRRQQPHFRPNAAHAILPLKRKFHATLRSATSILPFVSGLNSTATRKIAKPTTVVTSIGPDRPIW